MKIGSLSFFKRQHCNGVPCASFSVAALHWAWSLTWRWTLTWSKWNRHCLLGFHVRRVHRMTPGINFCATMNLPVIGHWNMQTQPNMRKGHNV